jgi:hypothetical protein
MTMPSVAADPPSSQDDGYRRYLRRLPTSDRSYKARFPVSEAEILALDVTHGKLDTELFRLFVERRLYERVSVADDQTTRTD